MVTNLASGISPTKLNHDEVMETANRVRNELAGLVEGVIERFRRWHRVVQRAESAAEPRSGRDGSVHEVEALHHCRFERPAEGEPGSDGGGERAAGAMQ